MATLAEYAALPKEERERRKAEARKALGVKKPPTVTVVHFPADPRATAPRVMPGAGVVTRHLPATQTIVTRPVSGAPPRVEVRDTRETQLEIAARVERERQLAERGAAATVYEVTAKGERIPVQVGETPVAVTETGLPYQAERIKQVKKRREEEFIRKPEPFSEEAWRQMGLGYEETPPAKTYFEWQRKALIPTAPFFGTPREQFDVVKGYGRGAVVAGLAVPLAMKTVKDIPEKGVPDFGRMAAAAATEFTTKPERAVSETMGGMAVFGAAGRALPKPKYKQFKVKYLKGIGKEEKVLRYRPAKTGLEYRTEMPIGKKDVGFRTLYIKDVKKMIKPEKRMDIYADFDKYGARIAQRKVEVFTKTKVVKAKKPPKIKELIDIGEAKQEFAIHGFKGGREFIGKRKVGVRVPIEFKQQEAFKVTKFKPKPSARIRPYKGIEEKPVSPGARARAEAFARPPQPTAPTKPLKTAPAIRMKPPKAEFKFKQVPVSAEEIITYPRFAPLPITVPAITMAQVGKQFIAPRAKDVTRRRPRQEIAPRIREIEFRPAKTEFREFVTTAPKISITPTTRQPQLFKELTAFTFREPTPTRPRPTGRPTPPTPKTPKMPKLIPDFDFKEMGKIRTGMFKAPKLSFRYTPTLAGAAGIIKPVAKAPKMTLPGLAPRPRVRRSRKRR